MSMFTFCKKMLQVFFMILNSHQATFARLFKSHATKVEKSTQYAWTFCKSIAHQTLKILLYMPE